LINDRSGFSTSGTGNYLGGCSSLESQPFAASDFSGSGRSQSTHCVMRLPLPPGGSARIMVAPQVGQVCRRLLLMEYLNLPLVRKDGLNKTFWQNFG
jgi:hypothetical protein